MSLLATDVVKATACRVCGTAAVPPYFSLGVQPLANAFRAATERGEEFRAPLAVWACPTCLLSQLTHVVAPERLYAQYAYYSGTTAAWREHCAALAREFDVRGKHVLDIACNDGTLLRACRAAGATVLGVDPAANFTTGDLPVITAYWPAPVGQRRFDLVVSQNVLGHVDDVHAFTQGVADVLAPLGRWVIEVPVIVELLANTAFDTIYHEHLSYWSATALQRLVEAHNLALLDATPILVHGGSMRFIVGRPNEHDIASERVVPLLLREFRELTPDGYAAFAKRVTSRLALINAGLAECDAIYGAAAKTTVLLNACTARPPVAYDDTPSKQGTRIPGTMIPVLAPLREDFTELPTLAIGAWNWAPQLMARARDLSFRGRFFVPLPTPRWEET